MEIVLKLLILAQTAFWSFAGWRAFVQTRSVMAEVSPSRPLSYVAGHWLLVALFAAFAAGSFLGLFGLD